MHIEKICLSNFRCFPQEETSISLAEDLTCFVGNNGSGKTALIVALKRVFGATREDRDIVRDDFHLSVKETYQDLLGRRLYIDITFGFPELKEVNESKETCPAFSSVIFTDEKDEILKARIRLESIWNETEYEDEVQSKIYWITTSEKIEFGEEGDFKQSVSNYDRRLIKLKYIPAFRDSKIILRNEIKSLIKLLENYTDIDRDIQNEIEDISAKLNNKVECFESIKTTINLLEGIWSKLHDDALKHYQKLKLEVAARKVSGLLRSLSIKLEPSESGDNRDISELSDGQVSLLYFALSIAIYEIEQKHHAQKIEGFKKLDKEIAVFTIFAIEEPENHLSPYYLGRILKLLQEKANTTKATGIITSHSQSVVRRMSRVEQIRHFRQKTNHESRYSVINQILLPEKKSENDYKYINQAVLAHPELYFAKLVVLGEGDSEEIIIPQLANKIGFDLDPSFVAFVKLRGRHTNHMWQLLSNLGIPYITLLDLDLGRHSGGLARIEVVINELKKHKKDINIDELNQHLKDKKLDQLLSGLEKYDIFFSSPLDLDMSMIQAFQECYKADDARTSDRETLERAVLGGKAGLNDYNQFNFFLSDEELKKYRNLFSSKSKVASHYQAMAEVLELNKEKVEQKCPDQIRRLIIKCSELVCKKIQND